MVSKRARDANLDSVRGLACLLLVAFHVVGGDGSGLRLPDHHPLRHLVDSLELVRMPLFTALSGYLFAARPPGRADIAVFARKKARRLLVPLVFATMVFLAGRALLYGEGLSLLAFFTSYQHLWFLQALALLLAGFGAWFAFGDPGSGRLAVVALAAALAGHMLPWTGVFSLSGAFYLAPFFTAGILIHRHRAELDRPAVREATLAAVLIVLAADQYELFGHQAEKLARTSLYAVLCGSAAALVLIQRMPAIRWLGAVGAYSFAIYLWHPLFGSAARRAIEMAHGPMLVALALSMAAAIAIPILAARIAGRVPVLSELVTGSRATA